MYSLTIFKNTFDNKTHKQMEFDTWEKFENLLYQLSKKEGQKGGSNSSPLISPANYQRDSTRSNKNVVLWGSWCCVDVDDYPIMGSVAHTLQSICGDYRFVCYSTASSTPTNPKFRLVFPLTEPLMKKDIPHFWHALNEKLENLGDKQTKDLSRMYYVPAVYPDAFNFFFVNDGKYINAKDLMEAYPYSEKTGNSFLERLPDSLREEVLSYRKNKLNKDVTWNSYRDCPFFPKKLAQEYMTITGTGWYHKMYQIMVAIAGNAVFKEYDISSKQIADLCKEFDNDNGKWYDNRPLEKEADRALEYVYRNM